MTDINRLKNQARRYEQQEQWPRAIELYSQAIDAIEAQGFGTDLSLYNRVGDLYLRQGDTARAVGFYERAVDRYSEQGLQTSAIALCNKILRIAPGRSEIYRTLGRLHAETGLQTQARRNIMEYASRMEAAGDIDAAIEALDEFVKLSADEEARTALGRHLISKDRIDEGVAHLRQVLADREAHDEECDEIARLIEEVAPGQSELDAPADTEADAGLDSDAGGEPVPEDHGPETAVPVPTLSPVEAAELDQIIADLGGIVEPIGSGSEVDPGGPGADGAGSEPADVALVAGLVEDGPSDTLGASITSSDSTLHDLLSEFHSKVDVRVTDSDSSVHYDLGIAYREMGMLDDAIREFNTAIEHDSGLLGARQLLAESLIQRGQYDAGVGAMAEFVKAVEPESDVSGQMERVSELLRASPSEDGLSELTQLLRSLGGPTSATDGSTMSEDIEELSLDELFPDLQGEVADAVSPPDAEDTFEIDDLEPPQTSDADADDDNALRALSEALIEPVEDVEDWADPAGLGSTWDPAELSDDGQAEPRDWEAESSWDAEAGPDSAEAIEDRPHPEPFSYEPEAEHDEEPAVDQDLEQVGPDLHLIEPDSLPGPELEEPEADGSDELDLEAELEADVSDELDLEAELEADVSDELDLETEPEADISDELDLETEPEADISDEIDLETEPEADISDEPEPVAERPAAGQQTEDLGDLLFGARLAKFRAKMARSASETDFQAHYDLGLAYKEVALFDEAVAELLVAITGPAALARKSLRLMSEVADLANDESLHYTTAEHLHQHGMTEEALGHLTRVHDARFAIGDDTAEARRRMSAIDPTYVPASVVRPEPVVEPEAFPVAGPEPVEEPEAAPEVDSPNLEEVTAQFDSILRELSRANEEAGVHVETPAAEDGDAATEPAAAEAPGPADEEDELIAWERQTAELLEDGKRDEAIREIYRLQAAYEAKEDFAGAMRAVGNLLLLDPEDVILRHQQVEYAMLLNDQAALVGANLELGLCLQRQGATTNARGAFDQVLEIDPDNEVARNAIAELDRAEAEEDEAQPEAGDETEAAPFAPEFAGDDPVHYETHYELGVAFKHDGLHDEAVYELEIAARGLEDPAPAYELLGELFNDAGQHETTTKVLGRALEANGRDDSDVVGVLYQLGVGHQALGDAERAAEYFRRVLQVASDYRDAQDRLNDCSL